MEIAVIMVVAWLLTGEGWIGPGVGVALLAGLVGVGF